MRIYVPIPLQKWMIPYVYNVDELGYEFLDEVVVAIVEGEPETVHGGDRKKLGDVGVKKVQFERSPNRTDRIRDCCNFNSVGTCDAEMTCDGACLVDRW